MEAVSVNILALVLSALWSMLLGMFWYTDISFGKEWRALTGMDEKKIKKAKEDKGQMMTNYGFTILSNLIMAYVLSHIIYYVDAQRISEGVMAGFWMWLGFVATTLLINDLFQGKSIKLYLIDTFYQLFVLLGMGAIISFLA